MTAFSEEKWERERTGMMCRQTCFSFSQMLKLVTLKTARELNLLPTLKNSGIHCAISIPQKALRWRMQMFYIVCLNITPTPLMTGGIKLAFLLIILLCHKNESLKSHWLPGKVGNQCHWQDLAPCLESRAALKKCWFVDCPTLTLR